MDQRFFTDLYKNRNIILTLSQRDFKNNYVGSSLGFIWTFIQPLAMAAILWVIFTYGFNSKNVGEVPFVLYMLTGLFPWNFFSETLAQNTPVIANYSYLVKKMPFQISALPTIKIISNLFIHAFFLAIIVVFLVYYKVPFSIMWFQSLYYLAAMITLVLAYSWLFSAIYVFFKDTSQIISILLQIGFWITPVFWTIDIFPDTFKTIIGLNPMVYIVTGYRDSFIYNIPFWTKLPAASFFWIGTIITMYVSSKVFKKLSPHFADVL